jgi:glutathione S-transferase
MILLGQFDSPFTRRVGIALTHYAMPFTRDTSSVFGDAAAVARISPLTRIPALILDDGEVLTDSTAILDHLDEVVGTARALVARQGPARLKVMQASALAMATTEKAAAVVYERFFHPPDHVSATWLVRCTGQIAAGLAELEQRCRAPWFCGDALTHADLMMACGIGYMRLRLPECFPPGVHPRLEALAETCEALPSFVACRISPTETMPDR